MGNQFNESKNCSNFKPILLSLQNIAKVIIKIDEHLLKNTIKLLKNVNFILYINEKEDETDVSQLFYSKKSKCLYST